MALDRDRLAALERRQSGAVSRGQLLALGAGPDLLASRVRRGAWQRPWPGTYLTFSGPPPWRARAWAALLYAGRGAALGFEAAAHQAGVDAAAPRVLDVWVPVERRVTDQPGLRVHRRARLAEVVVVDPLPRTRTERTVVDLTSRATGADGVVSVLTAGFRRGLHAEELRRIVLASPRQRWRPLLLALLADCEDGVESALEWRYHHHVERRHGLPRAELQVRQRIDGGWIRSDRRYPGYRLRVELDGRLAHPGGRTDADTWRDNEVALAGDELTLRYRWQHVAGSTCRTAAQVVRALRARGWRGRPRACSPTCVVR